MKKSLLLFCSLAIVMTTGVFAYNSDKGPVHEKDGISELLPANTDSLVRRGKELLKPLHCSDQDLEAIAAYVSNR